MQFELAIGTAAALVLTAAALTLVPVWARPGTYFGIRVSEE